MAGARSRPGTRSGLSFGGDGQIVDVVPGMVGDRSGLAPGMKVMGINGRLFSPQRLQDALADSVALRKIEFLLLEGDRFRTVGPRLRRWTEVSRAGPRRGEARPPGRDPEAGHKLICFDILIFQYFMNVMIL